MIDTKPKILVINGRQDNNLILHDVARELDADLEETLWEDKDSAWDTSGNYDIIILDSTGSGAEKCRSLCTQYGPEQFADTPLLVIADDYKSMLNKAKAYNLS